MILRVICLSEIKLAFVCRVVRTYNGIVLMGLIMGGKYSANVCHANSTIISVFNGRFSNKKRMFTHKLITYYFIKINLSNFPYL